MDKERKRTSPFYIVMTVIMTAVSVAVVALIVVTLLADADEGLTYGVQSVATSSNVSTEVAEVGDFSIYTKLYGDIVTDNAPVAQFSDVEGTVTTSSPTSTSPAQATATRPAPSGPACRVKCSASPSPAAAM